MVPKNRFRRFCFYASSHWLFDAIITTAIIFNVLLLTTSHWGQPTAYSSALNYVSMGFTMLFICEAITKICGSGWGMYWKQDWNRCAWGLWDIGLSTVQGLAKSRA